ncbi:MAG: ROK family protein [Nitriliruptoraceae bacterium]
MSARGLGIDIGGTQLRAAMVADDGSILTRDRRPTPADDPGSLVPTLVELIEAIWGRAGGRGPVAIGIAGLVTTDGTVRYGPNIGIRDLPLARILREALGAEVLVTNDASVAALGEHRAGAGVDHRDLVLVTLGTGVGGGVVIDGRLLTGATGFGGELGHVIVDEGGRPCPCGNRGCVEAYASGSAIGALARDRLVDPTTVTRLRDLEHVAGPDVTSAAHEGDAVAIEVLEEAGRWLGVALASLVNVLDPDLVLLGGGAAAAAAPWMLEPARVAMAERLVGSAFRTAPPVELAVLGDDAGVVGAGLLALENAADRAREPGPCG